MLEVRNLNVSFKNQKVLQGFNLNIENGEIVGILGKNGAGKTISHPNTKSFFLPNLLASCPVNRLAIAFENPNAIIKERIAE